MRRVNEAMRQVLSEALPTLKDPRIGFVTVTGVETTTDLEHATVWISVFGPERKRKATLDRARRVRQESSRRASTGSFTCAALPQLSFAYDQSVEQGVRMTQLIDELAPSADDDDGA